MFDRVVSESKKAKQFVIDYSQRKKISTKDLTQSIKVIKQNHRKISKQINRYLPLIKQLSPTAAKSITKQLKQLDEDIACLPETPSRKLVMCIEIQFMELEYADLVQDYNNLKTELKIYQELMRNTLRLED